jgi:molybdopterin synthase sulfur carrier subunit
MKTMPEIRVSVQTFATLREKFPAQSDLVLPAGETVAGMMGRLGIPAEKVTIIFINNVHGTHESLLSDGDSVGLFPPIGGG